jgi:hypothetical protein
MARQLASRLMRLPCGREVSWISMEMGEMELMAYLSIAGLAASSDVGTAGLLDRDGDCSSIVSSKLFKIESNRMDIVRTY